MLVVTGSEKRTETMLDSRLSPVRPDRMDCPVPDVSRLPTCRPLWTKAAQHHVEPLTVFIEVISPSVLSDPLQQICQAICCENQSSISNPPGISNVSRWKHRSRRHSLAIIISIPRRTDTSTV